MGFECVPKYVINVTKNWKVIVLATLNLFTDIFPGCLLQFPNWLLFELFFVKKSFSEQIPLGVSDIYIFLRKLNYPHSKNKYFFDVNLRYCASSWIFKIKSFGVWMTYFSSKMYIYLSYDGRFFCNKYLLKRGLTHNSPQ